MPDIIQTLKELYATDKAAALNMLPELFKQADDGQIVVIPYKSNDMQIKLAKAISRILYGMIQYQNAFPDGNAKECAESDLNNLVFAIGKEINENSTRGAK